MSHLSFSRPRRQTSLIVAISMLAVLSMSGCAPSAAKDAAATPAPTSVTASANVPHVAPPSGVAGKTTAEPSGVPPSSTSPTGTPVPDNKYGFVKPDVVRGIYLTAWSAASKRKMEKVLAMIDHTELNSVVIDVRDTGEMYFATDIPLAKEIGVGDNHPAIYHPEHLMTMLKAHNVWPIARIACFRDNLVPLKHPELAVQTPDGKVWRDRSKHSWLDPYNKKNWDYIAATVDYAISAGFPEIQLDYVRFPSEGKSNTQVFPAKKDFANSNMKPEDVIAAFAKFIGDKVKARGTQFSADIFGIISSSKRDQGIGQELEKLSAPFDTVSPMVYPSHFAKGEYGIKDPNRAPYEIITKSLRDYKRRVPNKAIRPWLQDFSLGYHYGAAEVRAQIKAANDLGYKEWLLWNAGNKYTESALKPKKQSLDRIVRA